MPQTEIEGRSVFWRETGDGPATIFLMGLETDHRGWFNVVPQLSNDLRCISIDNRDVGQSSPATANYTVADMAADVIAIADALSLETFNVVGQSMGGAIAQELGRRWPGRVRRMVLLSSFVSLPARTLRVLDGWKRLRGTVSPHDYYSAVLPWMYPLAEFEDKQAIDLLLDRAASNPRLQPVDAFCRQVDAVRQFDSGSWLSNVKIPALIVSGDDDLITPPITAKRLHSLLDRSEIRLVPKSGHALALTDKLNPEIPLIAAFLRESPRR
jgi:pimeloyl-ACP methyl ester carboxylesterase